MSNTVNSGLVGAVALTLGVGVMWGISSGLVDYALAHPEPSEYLPSLSNILGGAGTPVGVAVGTAVGLSAAYLGLRHIAVPSPLRTVVVMPLVTLIPLLVGVAMVVPGFLYLGYGPSGGWRVVVGLLTVAVSSAVGFPGTVAVLSWSQGRALKTLALLGQFLVWLALDALVALHSQ